ncbi:class II histone deacetylase [Streptomyces sp. SID3343]|uniref:class II histone deacetylase n=1 Tax=Streptomyces sp. SID3343 TaxID=2690260 RepID=UPI001367E30D|nr:class II histone deacetylase [Streptomyces sp. SID3343]MYW02701.1 class II histone deacetylase [Streptomyces sp. SID3343]
MSTGYVYHEMFAWHDTGTSAGLFRSDPRAGVQPLIHFENSETKRRIHELIVVSGLIDHLTRIAPRPATEDEILRVHDRAHLERIKAESERPGGGDAGDGLSPFGQGAYDIAALAAGGAIEAVDAVLAGRVDNAYALVRPPGHHAEPATGMGFCLFGNLAIAAHHAMHVYGLERIAVVDWDVHHGNGTQKAFYDDPRVLTISLHQDELFPPRSGYRSERGEGAGRGYALNVPLPPGTGDGGYLYAMDRAVVPALTRFRPELILVASGFDAAAMDPLGRQLLTSEGYRALTGRLLDVAAQSCGGRLAMSHEGGYNPAHVPFCGLAVIGALARVPTIEDPFQAVVGAQGGHDLAPHQREVIDLAAVAASDGARSER